MKSANAIKLERFVPHKKVVIQLRETEFDEETYKKTNRVKWVPTRSTAKSFVPGIDIEEIAEKIWHVLKPYLATDKNGEVTPFNPIPPARRRK